MQNNKVSILFLIQLFDSKTLLDSAGYNEILKPLTSSTAVSEHQCYSWGGNNQSTLLYLKQKFKIICTHVAQTPVCIYGAGAHTDGLWSQFKSLNVIQIADKQAEELNPFKFNIPVVTPDAITTDTIIISSRAWEESIFEELTTLYPDKTILKLYDEYELFIYKQNQFHLDEILKQYANQHFDLIIYTPSEPSDTLNPEQLKALKTLSEKLSIVWWDYDDTSEDNVYTRFEIDSLKVADHIIDPGNYTKTRKMLECQFPYEHHPHTDKIILAPTPVDPELFYPREKEVDVAIFGSAVGLRKKWIDALKKRFPSHFHHFGGVGIGYTPLPMNEYAALMGQTRIIVNSQTYSFRTQCKGKVREALASGCLLIEEDCYDTRQFIGEQTFVKYYQNEEQLFEIISYYLAHPEQCQKLAQQGYQWYLKHAAPQAWSDTLLTSFKME